MNPVITARHKEIAELCRNHNVARLDVFGSAVAGSFDSNSSDIDFLVEFESLPSVAYKRAYFGLLWGLEALFARPIDLVTAQSLRNPFFRQNVYDTREPVYGG